MKNLIFISLMAFGLVASAQEIWDDFTQGNFDPISETVLPKTTITTTDKNLPGGKRTFIAEIGDNTYDQPFSMRMQEGNLIVSSGYGVEASVKIGYGGMNRGAMNKDLSSYKVMKMSFKGKSNFARVYVNMWSNGPNRALWYGTKNTLEPFYGSIAPNGSNRGKTITVPLNALQNKNGKFSISDVDAIQIHLIGYEATGVNYALDKIWFE